jgi:hypothetical protein
MDYVTKFVPREQYNILKDALSNALAQLDADGTEIDEQDLRQALRKADAMEIGPSK